MNELRQLLQENLNIELISAILSNPRNKDGATKVKVRPLMKNEKLLFQLEVFQNNQAFHKNAEAKEAVSLILEHMENMKQMQLVTADAEFSVLISERLQLRRSRRKQRCARWI